MSVSVKRWNLRCAFYCCLSLTRALETYDIDCKEYQPELQKDENSCTFDEFSALKVDNYQNTFHNKYQGTQYESENNFNDWDKRLGKKTFYSYPNETLEHCTCVSTRCDCSRSHLKDVPKDLPHDVTHLNLALNLISSLHDCTFCNYSQLIYLDLSSNELNQLVTGSFLGLENLTSLNLYNNSLLYLSQTFPIGVFSDLKSLRCLKLNRNIDNEFRSSFRYPDTALSELTNLETLYLDGLVRAFFGRGFKNLNKLRSLVLAGNKEGYCKIIGFSDNSFLNVKQITLLNVSNCNLRGDKQTERIFKPLVRLQTLDINFNLDLGVDFLMRALRNMTNNSITSLRMNNIYSNYLPLVTITQAMIQSLPASLRYLETQGNNFQSVNEGALQFMPPNLSYIDAGGNRFLYGKYIHDLHSLKTLKVLKLNGGNNLHKIPTTEPTSTFSDNCWQGNSDARPKPLIFNLPPNLLCLDLRFSGLAYILSELTIDKNNSLDSMILSTNYFPVLQGPIHGLFKLSKLFISGCFVQLINERMFQNLDSLQELRLRNNELDYFFRDASRKPIFRDLKNLKILDLSINALTVFDGDILKDLDALEEINLSQNNMWQFNISISNMSNLHKLNLSYAQLGTLPLKTRQDIDRLVKTQNITVDMSSNPIRCDCNNIDFIQWMVSSRAFDANFEGYMCQYQDSSYKRIQDSYDETLSRLSVQCADHSTIFLVVLSVTLLMVTTVAGAVMYRFRWRLRYLYYVAYLVLKKKTKEKGREENFLYDVFLAYASEDEEFILETLLPALDRRELRVLVHGRDFAVGEFIASNIVTAVKESRKTLVVLTRNLLNSTWCNFELQMANMESVHTGRPVLVFLIKESIPTTELTADLLYHLNKNTYLVYPQGEVTDVFWNKLARDIMCV
ncbi:toll-like receptor 3 [Biomphalaria pfeifferi]|uniref:Toll-like receptor 3 n=1 Tax=Biomphalaria pfeifferi TaxID=112525 RepID=A0AAD8B8G0_BIOPF|nr:toll-like receptor 3 [Biomphalaria pfeifferi]